MKPSLRRFRVLAVALLLLGTILLVSYLLLTANDEWFIGALAAHVPVNALLGVGLTLLLFGGVGMLVYLGSRDAQATSPTKVSETTSSPSPSPRLPTDFGSTVSWVPDNQSSVRAERLPIADPRACEGRDQ